MSPLRPSLERAASLGDRSDVPPSGGIPGGPALVLLGINHTTAPLEVRERLAISPGELARATRALAAQPGIREALILSTCNRVELLTSADPAPTAVLPAASARFLHEFFAVPAGTLQPHLYEYREQDAVRHLFRVASSLDSLVVGEAQILGQVKESWSVAREVGSIAATLDPLLQRAFAVAKRVRTETEIGSSSVSVASVAVDLARKIFGTLEGKHVLIVGAGKMSELAVRHLIQSGASTIFISNRTEARARALASDLDTALPTQIIPFDQLHAQAHRADIVITSTGAGKIFTRAHGRTFLERRRNRPMFFIDIAVPRDVDPGLNDVEGCFVYDIDDLQQVAATNQASRSREAAAAEAIVDREVERYRQRLRQLDAVPAIRALQQQTDEFRQAELTRTEARLRGAGTPLSAEQLAAIDALTRSLSAKLLHPQLAALRAGAPAGDQSDATVPDTPLTPLDSSRESAQIDRGNIVQSIATSNRRRRG